VAVAVVVAVVVAVALAKVAVEVWLPVYVVVKDILAVAAHVPVSVPVRATFAVDVNVAVPGMLFSCWVLLAVAVRERVKVCTCELESDAVVVDVANAVTFCWGTAMFAVVYWVLVSVLWVPTVLVP